MDIEKVPNPTGEVKTSFLKEVTSKSKRKDTRRVKEERLYYQKPSRQTEQQGQKPPNSWDL